MPRPKSELTSAQRRAVQEAVSRLEHDQAGARDRFRASLLRLVEAGASQAAIARELGISRAALHERLNG